MAAPFNSRGDSHTAAVFREALHVPKSVPLDAVLREHPMLSRGQHIYRQDDPVRDIYFLIEGVLKAYRVSPNGEEGVVRFYYPSDLIWTDGTEGGHRTMSLVAATDCRVSVMPVGALRDLMSTHCPVQIRCYELLSGRIAEEQAFVSMLCHGTAERKLAFLLAQLCRRQVPSDSVDWCFRIPMTRGDIGNYLGLRTETISRCFTRLEQRRIVEVSGRNVRIINLPLLEWISAGEEEIPARSVANASD